VLITPDRLSVNQFMVPKLTLDELCRSCRQHEVAGIGFLLAAVEETGPAHIARLAARHGIKPTSLCVVMGLTAAASEARSAKLSAAFGALEAAAELEVPVVIVAGGPEPGLTLADATAQAIDALSVLDARAAALGTRALVEPLHPMLVQQSAITSVRQAITISGQLRACGVVLDTWHVWAEFGLDATLSAHGSAIDIVHLSDWAASPPSLDRELPGSGIIDLAQLAAQIGTATKGKRLWWEIEVLSASLTRRHSQLDLLALCVQRTRDLFWARSRPQTPPPGRDASCAS
jgi:sugar phosphate isomerase/epimerase